MPVLQISVGDTLLLKKKHPCGSDTMSVLRIGSDLRLQCTLCGRDLVIARVKMEKNIKQILPKGSQT